MSIYCPNCGSENQDGARFCVQCATALIQTDQPCPVCSTTNPPQARFCLHCAAPLRGSTPPGGLTGHLPPQTLLSGRYQIVRRMGRGGMGAVYQATDTRIIGKLWAIKEMSDAALTDSQERQQAREAFRREATILALLDHPNLPKVSDFFVEGDKLYLVMEFIEGQTLQERLDDASGPLSEAQVLNWAAQLCDVLGYLHSRTPPIIFRDLKPGNVMVDAAGQIKLIDFGVARLFKPGQARDTANFGTVGYAPPEQYGQGQTDARSDVYALGVLLHQLLTRYDPTMTPFNLPPARKVNPAVSAQVEQAIIQATQPVPVHRYQNMSEFKAALPGPVAETDSKKRRKTGPTDGRRGLFRPAAAPAPKPTEVLAETRAAEIRATQAAIPTALVTPPEPAKQEAEPPAIQTARPGRAIRRVWIWVAVAVLLLLAIAGGWLRLRADQEKRWQSTVQAMQATTHARQTAMYISQKATLSAGQTAIAEMSVTATHTPDLQLPGSLVLTDNIYDNFGNSAYNNSYNQALWQINRASALAQIVQQDGKLMLADTTPSTQDGVILGLAAWPHAGFAFFEARLMLEQRGSSEGGRRIGLVLYSVNLPGGYTEFFLNESQIQVIKGNGIVIAETVAKPVTWYTLRIAAANKGRVLSYFVDDNLVGIQSVTLGENIRLEPAIQLWHNARTSAKAWVDDVRIAPSSDW